MKAKTTIPLTGEVIGIDKFIDDQFIREIVTLSNGKRAANFSSPHIFTFEDGSVLPAVSDRMAENLKIDFIEAVSANGDVELTFSLPEVVKLEMENWKRNYESGKVNVVFCPLPMISAIKEKHGKEWLKDSPFRAVRIEDRIKKLVNINKQCI